MINDSIINRRHSKASDFYPSVAEQVNDMHLLVQLTQVSVK